MAKPPIIVCGLMGGGTSVVAGILHHLGINMGNIMSMDELKRLSVARIRHPEDRYQAYECKDIYEAFNALMRKAGGKAHTDTIIDMMSRYLRERRNKTDAVCGVKMPIFGLCGYSSRKKLETLRARFIRVDRSLDDVFASNIRCETINDLRSAETVGGIYYGYHQMYEKVLVSSQIQYEDVLKEPAKAVHQLMCDLDIDADDTQISAATNFVQVKK